MDKEKIYNDYHKKVLSYINGQVNDYYLAEDLCADVFVKVYEKIDDFDQEKASLSTWIFAITKNKLIDYYRSRKVDEEFDDSYMVKETNLVSNIDLQVLANALKKLDERSKTIVILHYYHDISLKDISVRMNLSYPYVKVLHKKALFILKNEF